MSEIKITGIGEILREYRVRSKLTLEQLAISVGCHRGKLSRYENNETSVSLEMIDSIAAALNTNPEEIVLKWIQNKYPSLNNPRTEKHRLISELISATKD